MTIRFRDISIRDKLRWMIMLTSGIVLLLSGAALVATGFLDFRRAMVRDLYVLADLVGISSTPGLLFRDSDAVQHNLSVLKADKNILETHIFTKTGDRFTSYFRGDIPASERWAHTHTRLGGYRELRLAMGATPRIALPPSHGVFVFTATHVEVAKQIRYHDEVIGSVLMRADLGEFHARMALTVQIVLVVFLAAMALAYWLAWRLQTMITTPMNELLTVMEEVGITRDYSIRLQAGSRDEVGRMIDGFNNMLAQIEMSTQQLFEYRAHLEEIVARRTGELRESRDSALGVNEALRRRTEELAEARDLAEAANHAKSAFLANMSHELRTPLNGILGYAQILDREPRLDPDLREGVRIIHRSGDYLLTLINDILDLSKIEAGRIELHPMEFHSQSFLNGLRDLFSLRAREKGIAFIDQVESLPAGLVGDEKRLRQVLINLLGNAMKFTHQGEVRLHVTYRDGKLHCQVEDTGVGIAPEDLDKIFQPFQQAGDVLQKSEGTGLGLAISQRLVSMMGGKLQVRSELGRGSSFTFSIPLPALRAQAPLPLAHATASTKITGYRRLDGEAANFRVLIVDDKADNRRMVADLLRPLGFEIALAEDGAQGLERTRSFAPDLCIVDLAMPRMDGIAMLQAMRATHAAIPVIMASARAFEQDRQRCLEAGAAAFVTKPIVLEILLDAIQAHVPLEWYLANETEADSEALDMDFPILETPRKQVFQTLALRGDIAGILEFAARLAEETPEARGFATRIERLAKQFAEEELCELAEHWLQSP